MGLSKPELIKMMGQKNGEALWNKSQGGMKVKKKRFAPEKRVNTSSIINHPITIHCPLSVDYKGTKYYLSMNNYRNWQFFISNGIKKEFEALLQEKIKGFRLQRFEVEYRLFYPDNRRRDKMNFISVISKFFFDTLTMNGNIEDDNDDIVRKETIYPPSIDQERPRCEITITPISFGNL